MGRTYITNIRTDIGNDASKMSKQEIQTVWSLPSTMIFT